MKKKWWLLAALVVVGIVAWLLLKPSEVTAQQFEFATIDRGDLEAIVSSTGTLSAVTTVTVGTQVSGRIAKLYADFNQQVKEGQLLAQLDTAPLIQQVNNAQAAYDRASVQLKQAKMDFDRTAALFKDKFKPQSDMDTAEINLALAKTALKTAQINLEQARINLGYASIYSPIDGVVISRSIDVGQTVAASFSAPTLFQIANDLKKMQILANVDEADIGQIKDGQAVRFTVQAHPEKKFTGRVTQIRMQPTTTSNVVNYTVVVQVDNSGGELLPGMTATIDFLIGEARNVLRVPNAALRLKPTTEMMQELIKSFRARFAQAGGNRLPGANAGSPPAMGRPAGTGGGMGGGFAGNGVQRPKDVALLWFIKDGKPAAVRVRTGLTDGQMTEIRSGDVKEGMDVIKAFSDGTGGSTSSQRTTVRRPPMMF